MPYAANKEGLIVPELPTSCPCCTNELCEIGVDHQRERKTGPGFPLYVMRCKTHALGFTLYPYGYYPYSRHTLVPVDIEGNQLTKSDANSSLLIGTLFEAAEDAADGIQWQIGSNEGSLQPRYLTQLRHIQRAAILLGIDPDTGEYRREEAAQILTVAGQLLHDTSNQINLSTCGHQCYGEGICNIFQCIPTGMLFERLAEAGAIAGLWPTPIFLVNNKPELSLFHRVRTRGSPKKKGDH